MRLLLILFVVLSATLSVHAQDGSANAKKIYGIESGRIVWRFFNGPQEGVKTLYFKDWGRVEKMYAEFRTDSALVSQFAMRIEEWAIDIDEAYEPKSDEFDLPEGVVIQQ